MRTVAVANIVSRDLMKILSANKPDVIIYARLESSEIKDANADILWIDYSKELALGIRYGYAKVRNILREIEEKQPDFFKCGDYNLFEAMNKDVFWAQFNELLADFALSELGETRIIYDYRRTSGWRETASGWKQYFNLFRTKGTRNTKLDARNKVAVRINNPDLIPMLGHLPEAIGSSNLFYFATDISKFKSWPEGINVTAINDLLPDDCAMLRKRWRQISVVLNGVMKNVVMNRLINLHILLSKYEFLCSSGCKSILINAGENDGEGHVLAQVARKHGVISANFMNGTKAFDVVNQGAEFDFWFMHDETMQELATRIYGIPKERLPVVGHLLEDVAKSHKHSGLLYEKGLTAAHKFVIAFFTSPLFFDENINAYSAIEQFLDSHPDCIAFVKPHPHDKLCLWDRKHSRIVRLDFRTEKTSSENVLFDMLSVANCSVSIASTVSFQASWFGIPSFTFEMANESRLPYTDGKRISHIRSRDELVNALITVYNESSKGGAKNTELQTVRKSVAEKTVAYLTT
ncbi:MAG: hypothetical protein L6Q81_08580 [Bacteroidia bacterium]|nr:hypothetical protein [Bacteroidia bacterium]